MHKKTPISYQFSPETHVGTRFISLLIFLWFAAARGEVPVGAVQHDKLGVRLAKACTAGLRGRRADPTP